MQGDRSGVEKISKDATHWVTLVDKGLITGVKDVKQIDTVLADVFEQSSAIDRQHVKLEKAQNWTPRAMAASGPLSRDPDSPRYSPSGVWGNPTLASEDKGRRLLTAIIDDLLAVVEVLGA